MKVGVWITSGVVSLGGGTFLEDAMCDCFGRGATRSSLGVAGIKPPHLVLQWLAEALLAYPKRLKH